ncbi:hypothetical protein C8J56DRAFT_1164943 [Mycena floridula]|nr:hypothetical protein C8J56DRAFT_1164943 [Mycena floridula]
MTQAFPSNSILIALAPVQSGASRTNPSRGTATRLPKPVAMFNGKDILGRSGLEDWASSRIKIGAFLSTKTDRVQNTSVASSYPKLHRDLCSQPHWYNKPCSLSLPRQVAETHRHSSEALIMSRVCLPIRL